MTMRLLERLILQLFMIQPLLLMAFLLKKYYIKIMAIENYVT